MTAFAAIAALVVSAGVDRAALVVGANRGLADEAPLQFAESDAREVASALVEVGVVPQDGVKTLTHPRLVDLKAALDAAAALPPEDLFVFYFSGHGDAAGIHLRGEQLPWRELSQALGRMRSRRVLGIVDSCDSGALLTAKGILQGPPIEVAIAQVGLAGHFLITSSGSNEASYESTWLQGSPFSKTLVSGLRGAADLDRNGQVTIEELYRYVYQRSLAATVGSAAGPQHPGASSELSGEGDWVLAEVGARAPITRGATTLGACYLLDAEGARVLAELPARPGRIAVAPGAYQLKCVAGTALASARVEVPPEGLALDAVAFSMGARSYALAKGRRAPAEHQLSLEVGPRIESGGQVAPEVLAGYRSVTETAGLEFQLGADLRNGPLMALLGLSVRIPWWEGDPWVDLGLSGGAQVNPFRQAERDASLLFGPTLRISAPIGDRATLFFRALLLTRVAFDGGSIGTGGLLTLGASYDFPPQ